MKTALIWFSIALNVILLVMLLARRTVHSERKGDQKITTFGRFSIVEQVGFKTNEYVVFFDGDRFFWTISGNVVSVNCGLDQSASLTVNPTNGRVERTSFELLGEDSEGCYIADFNADGIPDKRQIKGSREFQVFFKGEFYDSFVDGNNRYITLDGKKTKVRFSKDRWSVED